MNSKMKKLVLLGVKNGYNGASLALNLSFNFNKYGITKKDYLEYVNWYEKNSDFFYWLYARFNDVN